MRTLKLSEPEEFWWGAEKEISKHSRKLNGQKYVSPRIVLPPSFNDLIGKSYRLFEADAELEYDYWRYKEVLKGKALILFIVEKREQVLKEDTGDKWEDEDVEL